MCACVCVREGKRERGRRGRRKRRRRGEKGRKEEEGRVWERSGRVRVRSFPNIIPLFKVLELAAPEARNTLGYFGKIRQPTPLFS